MTDRGTVEWSEEQRARLAAEYRRVGSKPGEPWPAPPEELGPDEILALFARIPDGAGRDGFTAELGRLWKEKRRVARRRIALNVIGVLCLLTGCIWILQGINVLPGSFMTGQMKWAIYGGALAVAGTALLMSANRRWG
jgi:hypothetical protein